MNEAARQSIKARLQGISKETNRDITTLWHNLVVERFLARLCASRFREHFVLKGGTLLARYISLGRFTYDVDFLVEKFSNAVDSLDIAIRDICSIDLGDAFVFEQIKIGQLTHPHMDYMGVEVTLLARLGRSKTYLSIDLAFGDIVEAVDLSLDLTKTKKGPIFESKIHVRCYPKEFIFAEKLETVIYRRQGNTRMKDFHDLLSLVSCHNCLDTKYAEKAIIDVFHHREAPLDQLPLQFNSEEIQQFQAAWLNYLQDPASKPSTKSLPENIKEVIAALNRWLSSNTSLCR